MFCAARCEVAKAETRYRFPGLTGGTDRFSAQGFTCTLPFPVIPAAQWTDSSERETVIADHLQQSSVFPQNCTVVGRLDTIITEDMLETSTADAIMFSTQMKHHQKQPIIL